MPNPEFDWQALWKALQFYQKERLRYFPLLWGDKRPAIKEWKPLQNREPTIKELTEWFQEGKPTNVAIICGGASNGLVALCFNDPDGAIEFFGQEAWDKLLTSTFIVKTARGVHVYLHSTTKIPSQFVTKESNLSWLEIRSDGNYIAAPPSLHPSGILYENIGVEIINRSKNLTEFLQDKLARLGLKARLVEEPTTGKRKPQKETLKEESKEFYELEVAKLLENCPFIQYCRDSAVTLSEPYWWSMVCILSTLNEPGRQKIHELSAAYPGYTEEETERKIKEALKAGDSEIGPHTCEFIKQSLGFNCSENCLAKKLGTKSPAGLAYILATTELRKIKGITIDGVTYYQKNNQIFSSRPGKKEDSLPMITTLANFSIEPKLKIELEGEDERLGTIIKTSKAEYPILFKKSDFNSRRQVLSALPVVDLEYYGTDKDTQPILALLNKEELPKRKGTKVLGRNGDLWVVKDMVISKDGIVEDPELLYVPSEVGVDRQSNFMPAKTSNTPDFGNIIELLLKLNKLTAILPILGWFFATPFTPLIRERLTHFPLLSLWGTHGSGKSSVLELLWELFGVNPPLYSATNTRFSFLRLFSATSSIPIILDEYKPYTMRDADISMLLYLLKAVYDGKIETRGRPDLSLVPFRLQSPIVIAGEETPASSESALTERIIQVNLSKDTLMEDDSCTNAFGQLRNIQKQGFAFTYIKWCLGSDIDELMVDAKDVVLEHYETAKRLAKVPQRIYDNIWIMVTGLVALREFYKVYSTGKGEPLLINNENFNEAVNGSINELLIELLGEKGAQPTGLTVFLETLATLAQTGRIKYGIHYATGEYGAKLYIHLEDCLAEFRRFNRETNARIEVLDKKAYLKQANEEQRQGGYIIDTLAQKWFPAYEEGEGKNRKCIEIDMAKLPLADMSGFIKPGLKPTEATQEDFGYMKEPNKPEGIDMSF